MFKMDFKAASYFVSGLDGFTLTEALRFWRAKYETIADFRRDVIKHPALEELFDFTAEMWDSIEPISVQEALQEANLERRRVMFDCIGVVRLFKELKPELLDKQTITKSRTRWNRDNEPYEYHYEDTYELYQLDGKKLFDQQPNRREPAAVYAVRCWCTSTQREYWIYVPEDAALGEFRWNGAKATPDAIRAIAWTFWIDITHPKRIFRQGDIIIVEESEDSKDVAPYHLNKEQYLQLLYSET